MFTNFGRMNTRQKYDLVIRTLSGLFAIVVWGLSIWFSSKGFNIAVPSVLWAGWVLGCLVTVLELVGNRGYTLRHPILAVSVVAAYLYGIWTNITGVASFSTVQPTPIHYIIGIVLEVVPEPLILFAVLGNQMVHSSKLDPVIGRLGMLRPDSGGGGEPIKKQSITCYYCGKNHFAKDCPDRDAALRSKMRRKK